MSRIDARSRADRYKIRDLEHELSTLKRRLTDAEREREALALPALPVEVRAPEESPASPPRGDENGAPGAGAETGEVVGIDDEGVEIVYVGEAARDQSVRPRVPASSYVPSRSPGWGAGRSRRRAGDASSSPPTIDWQMESARSDRIPVTGRVGPKVDRLVRETPRAAPERTPAARSAPGAAPEPAPAAASPAVSGPMPAPRAGEPKADYRRALEALRAGNHAAAIDEFRALVARYPRHDLADNAQYWLGEALYDQRLYRDALVEFRKVVDNHPRGNKVPDALLKIGYCHAALGEPDEARPALELVMSMYPKSKPAALAARRIETLAEE